MKAVIVTAEKQTLPQFNSATGQDEPTLVVVTTVNFYNDDGTLHSTQSYAQRPSEIDPSDPQAYFDRQASVLQNDIDGRQENAESQATSELADQIVEKLMPTKDESSQAE
jgi:hypothetical protein